MNKKNNSSPVAEDKEIHRRRLYLKSLRDEGVAFPNHFRITHHAKDLKKSFSDCDAQELEQSLKLRKIHSIKVAGRIMFKRIMGKASFIQIKDDGTLIQAYLTKNSLGDQVYSQFKQWDLGDIVGIQGTLFKTKTDELTIHVNKVELLVKNLRPLPDKYHGLKDTEIRYRLRYVDLIMDDRSRQIFEKRSLIIRALRSFLDMHRFTEVETPMMHPVVGGANAQPFTTHHNALDLKLYMRIAPELYLKRLVVGGFNRVYEINRNFRNEGISTRHNPEFSMLEFYQAYSDYHDLMDFTEQLFVQVSHQVNHSSLIRYQGVEIDFARPFVRKTLKQAVIEKHPELSEFINHEKEFLSYSQSKLKGIDPSFSSGKLWLEWFEQKVESYLIQPTFITEYPLAVSPLSRTSDHDPQIVDRFELFIAGNEIANGFSELNDSEDQEGRFLKQLAAKKAGDQEAMSFDEDYVEALEYGMPPTAGEGIGIDRLVMLLTDCACIRDVLFFPLLKPKQKHPSR